MREHWIVNPPELGPAVGFAHAVVTAPGRTVWLGGQIGGGDPDHLVSLVVYTTALDEYRASTAELGEVWRRHFGKRYPAMALVGVSALFDPDARVELMGVAVVPE